MPRPEPIPDVIPEDFVAWNPEMLHLLDPHDIYFAVLPFPVATVFPAPLQAYLAHTPTPD